MGPLIPLRPGEPPVNFMANMTAGFDRKAAVRGGAVVHVWVPGANTPPNQQYFCHGHSLGTFNQVGYSVFSGASLQTVLNAEWNLVGGLHHAKMGDIVVWHGVHGNLGQRMADHSALIKTVGMGSNLQIDTQRTILSSKNGTGPLDQNATLASLIQIYGNVYALYRRK